MGLGDRKDPRVPIANLSREKMSSRLKISGLVRLNIPGTKDTRPIARDRSRGLNLIQKVARKLVRVMSQVLKIYMFSQILESKTKLARNIISLGQG